MNKNLEKEYKELMTEDAPDLWERIAAGLEPKQPTAKKDNIGRRYRRWGLAVAACMCMIVIAPVILRKTTDRNMRSDSADSAPAYDVGMADGSLNAVENAGALFEAPSDEDTAAAYTIMGTVTEVLEEADRRVYIVDIIRTDLAELSVGDSIRLYSYKDFKEDIWKGEEYLFDIAVSIDNTGTTEYLIEGIW